MTIQKVFSIAMLLVLGVSGSNAQTKAAIHPSADDSLRKEVASLKQQVATLAIRLTSLESDLATYKSTQEFDKELSKRDSVMLDPSNPQGYSRLDTANGWFLISLKSAEVYLDGYKLTLNIGNPSSATYTGLKIKTKWNSSYDWTHYSESSFKVWQAAMRSKDDDLTDALQPGAWNSVEIILPQTKPTELSYVQVSIETNTVSLRVN